MQANNGPVQHKKTQKPNQRMISIPVFGGDNLEKASANEKQGEAFAILPPDLYINTLVHIKLWLNKNGIFKLSAQLDNGLDLNPWIMHGETDQKAVEALHDMEKKIDEIEKELPSHQRKEIENQKEEAFEEMKQGNFKEANKIIDNIKMTPPPPLGLKEKAEQLIVFSQFILHEYKWALDPNKTYQLTNLISEVKNALKNDDMTNLEEKVEELEKETDNLPQVVNLLLSVKGAIEARIRPFAPREANELQQEMQMLEEACKAGDLNAIKSMLSKLMEKVTIAIERVTPPDKDTCPNCNAKLNRKRICSGCGYDSYLLTDQQTTTTSSSQNIRRL